MCSLTTQFGITWNVVRLAGKTVYMHHRLVIAYSVKDKQWHFCQNGISIYQNKSVGECLEASSELILDAYADAIVPSWDNSEEMIEIVFEDDEPEPITERYPSNYIPDWAEAAA